MMNTHEAQQSILNIIGGGYMERWPVTIINVLFGNAEYSYTNRRDIGTFLYGNVRDANLVYLAVREQLGNDPLHHDHMRRWLVDIASGKYDDKYHYFDVLLADWYFLGGALNTKRSPPSACVRLWNAWEVEWRRVRREEGRWPSLAEQSSFLTP